jgi:preprotein translocase SecE subunit
MFKHRPGEGVYARGVAFWTLAGFAFLYARRLFLWLDRYDVMRKVLVPEIPVLGAPLTPGFLAGLAGFTLLAWGAWRLMNAPKIGDLLIDTELEMKKVTWPSLDESWKASLVVIFCVIVMVAFLSASDMGLSWFFSSLVYGVAAHGQ